jgi:hypothetical protein
VRRQLAPGLDLDEFFERLRRRGVCYVVLRWFDDLPHVDRGEDIDLLVADEDLDFVRSLMAPRRSLRTTQKFDIYSVSGLPGSDFKEVPYYGPRFAREMLERGEWLRDRYRVPSLQDHYDSLAYHALYHKGYASGLSDGMTENARRPADHDYEAVLLALSQQLGRPLGPTLTNLDEYLADRGLRPPLDTLERLEPGNPWIRDRFFSTPEAVDEPWQGLAVFVLRDRARTQVDVAARELDRHGFELLEVVELDPLQREVVGHRVRGGNWGRGPWPLAGGDPAVYLIAYDVAPQLDELSGSRTLNRRIPPAKEHVRDRLLADVPPAARYNPIHSSDNPGQALDYLDALGCPDLTTRVAASAQRLVDSCAFPFPVVRPLGAAARRAQVAVVDHPVHGLSVCKVFRPGAARFFERELQARRELSDLAEVPGLLECGERWVLTPLYQDDRSHIRRVLPGDVGAQLTPATARALARFAVALHRRGLFLLDLSTHNLVSDPTAGLKVLDLEFLQEYAPPVPEVDQSYTFRGVSAGIDRYDVPQRTSLTRRVGGSAFHPAVTGSSVGALLVPRRPLDGPRRALVQCGWFCLLLGEDRLKAARDALAVTWWGKDLQTVGGMMARRVGLA